MSEVLVIAALGVALLFAARFIPELPVTAFLVEVVPIGAAYDFLGRQIGVDLYARNLTDKRAAASTADPTQGGYVYMLRPRELGIEVRYSFDKPLASHR